MSSWQNECCLDVVSDFLHDWVMFGLEHTCNNGESTPETDAFVSYRWTNQNKWFTV